MLVTFGRAQHDRKFRNWRHPHPANAATPAPIFLDRAVLHSLAFIIPYKSSKPVFDRFSRCKAEYCQVTVSHTRELRVVRWPFQPIIYSVLQLAQQSSASFCPSALQLACKPTSIDSGATRPLEYCWFPSQSYALPLRSQHGRSQSHC